MTIAINKSEIAGYVAKTLAQACQKDDIKQLRNLLRDLFGKQLQDLVKDKTSHEQYEIESPLLKDAIKKRLPVACAKNGSIQCLKVLMQRLPGVLDLDQRDSEGSPCLHLAVTGHHVETALYLIDNGVDVNAVDGQGRSALHWAIVCQIPELLSRLVIKKANLNCQDAVGATPLHYAAQMCGNREVDMYVSLDGLQHLLCLRPKLNCRDTKGRTPLLWAASAGSPDACKLLVRAGAPVDDADDGGSTALHVATRKGFGPVVSALVRDCSATLELRDGNGQTATALALTSGKIDCLIRLVKLGASEIVDDKEKSIGHVAAASGDLDLVKKLQSAGLQFWSRTQRGELPVHFAVIAKHNDVACHLLQDKNCGNPRGSVMKTCLHLAVRTSNKDLIGRLLDMGADINSVLQYQGKYMSPLDVATEKSLEDSLAYVLEHSGQSARVLIERSAFIIQRAMRRLAAARKRKRALSAIVARRALEHRSAFVIQRAVRRAGALRKMAALRRQREQERRRALEDKSAAVLQHGMRRMVARKKRRRLADERRLAAERRALLERSAAIVQRTMHRLAAVRRAQALRRERRERERSALELRSAITIQCAVRRMLAVHRLRRLREEKLQQRSALVIQRAFRRLMALLRLPKYRSRLDALRRDAELDRSARIVQRTMRRAPAVRQLRELRAEKRAEEERRRRELLERSARVVQRALRRLVAVKRLALPAYHRWLAERSRRQTLERSAAVVQRTMRRVAAMRRRRAALLERQRSERERREREARERSAVVLQRAARRLLAVRRLESLRRQREREALAKRAAALVVQRAVRRFVAVKRLAADRFRAWSEARQRRRALEERSARRVQRFFRLVFAVRKAKAETARRRDERRQRAEAATASHLQVKPEEREEERKLLGEPEAELTTTGSGSLPSPPVNEDDCTRPDPTAVPMLGGESLVAADAVGVPSPRPTRVQPEGGRAGDAADEGAKPAGGIDDISSRSPGGTADSAPTGAPIRSAAAGEETRLAIASDGPVVSATGPGDEMADPREEQPTELPAATPEKLVPEAIEAVAGTDRLQPLPEDNQAVAQVSEQKGELRDRGDTDQEGKEERRLGEPQDEAGEAGVGTVEYSSPPPEGKKLAKSEFRYSSDCLDAEILGESTSGADFGEAAEVVRRHNSISRNAGASRSDTPVSRAESAVSQHYSTDDSDFDELALATDPPPPAIEREDTRRVKVTRRSSALKGGGVGAGAAEKPRLKHKKTAVERTLVSGSGQLVGKPARPRSRKKSKDVEISILAQQRRRRRRQRQQQQQQQAEEAERPRPPPQQRHDSGINSLASSTADAASEADSMADESAGAGRASSSVWGVRRAYALRPPALSLPPADAADRHAPHPPTTGARSRRRPVRRPPHDLLALPDVCQYFAGVRRWEVDFPRPASESLRLKVQLSVRKHEVYKAIAKGYNTAHTKTTASIPSFPVISPVKYLTAAAGERTAAAASEHR